MTNNEQNDPFELGISQMEKFMEKYEIRNIRNDFFQKISLLIIASIGFVSAIAWDQALKLIFIEFFGSIDSVWQKILYAVIITIIAVLISIILTKFFLKKK